MRREAGLLIERNIPVPMRDGVRILIDLYRPEDRSGERELPLLLGWSPYDKHNLPDRLGPAADVGEGWISKYTAFEAPDPLYWCRHGYAVIYPDPRGSWHSEGEMRHGGVGEGEDCYDLTHTSANCHSTPGEPVPVTIEIWPSSTLFHKGERLRVLVKGQDIYTDIPQGPAGFRHEDLRNRGTHILRTGGRFDAHLLIPVIPAR